MRDADVIEQRDYTADEVRAMLAAVSSRIENIREPLTYARERTDRSFFRDMLLADRDPQAALRQEKHRDEMRVELPLLERRRQAAADQRAANDVEFEYRINPNLTLGQGGEFAPPLWLNQAFATAPRVGRVLTNPKIGTPIFPTPPGVSSVNLARITTGDVVLPTPDLSAVPGQDILDAAVSTPIVAFTGQSDVDIQLLEQSPQGAHFDWVTWTEMLAAYIADFESQLLLGTGINEQFYGLLNLAGINIVNYTGATSATGMFPYYGQTLAAVGKTRKRPAEVWMMTTSRHAWIGTSEDVSNRPLGLADYQGNFPIGSLVSYPVYLNDAVPTNLTYQSSTTSFTNPGTQDVMIACKPSDMIVFEGQPRVAIMPEPLSGVLGVRLQLRSYGGAILGRYPSGVSVLAGTGMAVQSGF